MELTNSFTIPLPPNQAWPLLLDVQRVAPCVPGAELTRMVDEQTFEGRTTVKVGPIKLAFDGTASLVDVDHAGHTARLVAQGSDTKGRGGAQAEARFVLEPDVGGSRVTVTTLLNMSGAVAQYGRASGLMQEIANQIVSQFAANLAAMLSAQRVPLAAGGSLEEVNRGGQTDMASASPAEPVASKPISAFALLTASIRGVLRRWLGRGGAR